MEEIELNEAMGAAAAVRTCSNMCYCALGKRAQHLCDSPHQTPSLLLVIDLKTVSLHTQGQERTPIFVVTDDGLGCCKIIERSGIGMKGTGEERNFRKKRCKQK